MIQIEIFPAINGDCFLIHTDEGLILIDCGYVSTYSSHLKPALEKLNEQGKSILRFILTHIDEDHIQGAIKFLAENGNASNPQIIKIDQIWHNSYKHLQAERADEKISSNAESILKSSFKTIELQTEKQISAKQGSSLAALILQNGYNWNNDFEGKAFSIDHFPEVKVSEKIKFELLSPDDAALNRLEKYWRKELYKLGFRDKITKQAIFDDAFEFVLMNDKIAPDETSSQEISASDFDVEELRKQSCVLDRTPKNGSSLAFILTVNDKKMLFLGDAIPSIVNEQLEKKLASESKPVLFDLIKLSHHGSYASNSPKLFEITDARNYLVSTKGESSPHPSKATLAWLVGRSTENLRKIYFNYENSGYDVLNKQTLKTKYNYEVILSDQLSNRKITI
ncbi:AVAST type 1 anti-phage system MBL fold metallo-hydrolase Avs1a [Flavobacterium sp. PL02]|uniref:AVAST type 1 anti-phage system MBL fold metallo-hydrolase Avs1a n=1 Tax=Flavobacterium sp. PL02 TaxID=3088354 RepID=UPI002B234D4D|nr:AVAST type 1 anti-phage system MBL fold metallo-hydrolase Avs1a [Flavobacterium sp. PL02]MEA9414342.1 AVAST type 1 anti-phage system MBL fold metallo-hydrolase Avs1a [Flavobacterium sp. PL02]